MTVLRVSGRPHLQDRLDFDARAQWKLGHSNGGARVPALVAEDVYEQLRRAVNDKVLAGEVGVAVHVAGDAQYALDAVEGAQLLPHQAQHVGGAQGGGLARVFQGHLRRDLALAGEVAVAVEGDAAGDVDRGAVHHDRLVDRAGREPAVEGKSELLELAFAFAGQGVFLRGDVSPSLGTPGEGG